MPKYRLMKGTHSMNLGDKRVDYVAGQKGHDIMELTEEQAKLPHLRKRIEKAYGEDSASAGSRESPNRPSATALDLKPDQDDDNDDTDPKISAVLSGNVDQVLTYINDHADDDETLEALRDGEKAGKQRKTVLDAIDNLLEG